jgi:hypothetical protein
MPQPLQENDGLLTVNHSLPCCKFGCAVCSELPLHALLVLSCRGQFLFTTRCYVVYNGQQWASLGLVAQGAVAVALLVGVQVCRKVHCKSWRYESNMMLVQHSMVSLWHRLRRGSCQGAVFHACHMADHCRNGDAAGRCLVAGCTVERLYMYVWDHAWQPHGVAFRTACFRADTYMHIFVLSSSVVVHSADVPQLISALEGKTFLAPPACLALG